MSRFRWYELQFWPSKPPLMIRRGSKTSRSVGSNFGADAETISIRWTRQFRSSSKSRGSRCARRAQCGSECERWPEQRSNLGSMCLMLTTLPSDELWSPALALVNSSVRAVIDSKGSAQYEIRKINRSQPAADQRPRCKKRR